MSEKITLYVASPYGFSEACRPFMKKVLIPTIKNAGAELGCKIKVINPWDLTPEWEIADVKNMFEGREKREAEHELDMKIGRRNISSIDRCDGLIAVLDGADVDSGVAAEVGYAVGKEKPVLGYRGDFRLSSENLGTKVNLQVQTFIENSGGRIVTSVSDIARGLKYMFQIP